MKNPGNDFHRRAADAAMCKQMSVARLRHKACAVAWDKLADEASHVGDNAIARNRYRMAQYERAAAMGARVPYPQLECAAELGRCWEKFKTELGLASLYLDSHPVNLGGNQ